MSTCMITHTSGHLGTELIMLVIVSQRNQIVSGRVEANCIVELSLLIWRPDSPHALYYIRVVSYKFIRTDARQRPCVCTYRSQPLFLVSARLHLARDSETCMSRSVCHGNVGEGSGGGRLLPYSSQACFNAKCMLPRSVLRNIHHLLNAAPGGPGICLSRRHDRCVETEKYVRRRAPSSSVKLLYEIEN